MTPESCDLLKSSDKRKAE